MCSGLREGSGDGVAVLKFGSSLLEDVRGYFVAAEEVCREVDAGRRVVAVCSAQRGVTDHLTASAGATSPRPPEELVARLLATGEHASVTLLALALASRGVEAHVLDADELGLRTIGPLLDADPVAVDLEELEERLRTRRVVVVPGFLGVDASGRPSVLGRGGSDLTALFLAQHLGASECRLVKDVDGLYPADPKLRPGLSPLAEASWEVALSLAGGLVQEKALRFASRVGLPFRISAPGGRGTWVGARLELAT